MNKSSTLINYDIVKEFNQVFAFTTTKATLGINRVRFSNCPENKAKLATKLGLQPQQLVFPKQKHTATIFKVDKIPTFKITETDALITNKLDVCLCIQTADCVPILLFDPVKNAIAAIHAGWRGTVAGIVEKTINRMSIDYGCSAKNIRAIIGPSISPEIYEVGNEVVDAAQKSIPNSAKTLHKNKNGKYHLNLWEANSQFLLKNGVDASNIQLLGQCSYLEKDKYYSARRDGASTGRMVSGIMMKDLSSRMR